MQKRILIILAIFIALFFGKLLSDGGIFWDDQRSIDVKGDRMTLYNKLKKVVLRGNTIISRDDLKILSDKTQVWQKEQKFEGYGNVSAEKKFESGDIAQSFSRKIFYNEKSEENKIIELDGLDYLDYFSKKDDKTLNVLADYIKIEEKKGLRSADLKKVISLTLPFEERKDDGRILTGTTTIKADLIKAIEKVDDANYAEIFGNIAVKREYANGEYFFILAEECEYIDDKAKFQGVEKLEIFNLEENTIYYLYCDQLTWDLKGQTGMAIGAPLRFEKNDKNYLVTANIAYFNKAKQEVFFTENPIARQNDEQGVGIYQARDILYYLDTKIMKMLGDVDIDFLPNKKVESEQELEQEDNKEIAQSS
ncbi:MAG: hypothetical protein GY817_00460 [bacterium]|nr:hypothetical protein [bacterium]